MGMGFSCSWKHHGEKHTLNVCTRLTHIECVQARFDLHAIDVKRGRRDNAVDMKKSFISTNPHIMGGIPVIAGTRIPVSRIIHLLGEGHTIDSIHMQYPHVSGTVLSGTITELIHRIDNREYDQTVS